MLIYNFNIYKNYYIYTILPCSAKSISRLPNSLSLISLTQKSLNPELLTCLFDLTGISSSDKLAIKKKYY